MEAAKRYKANLSVILFDLDDFKVINDSFGHPNGDVVLMTVSRLLQENLRRIDIVGRLGGEEFMVIMPHTSSESAFLVAERIRKAVQEWSFTFFDHKISVTLSGGLATYPAPGISGKNDFLKVIDQALYQAKRSGKNRTVKWQKVKENQKLATA